MEAERLGRYKDLLDQYTAICDKNELYRNEILEFAATIKTSLTDYLGCDSAYINFISFANGSQHCSQQESLFFDEENMYWVFGLGIALLRENEPEFPALELMLPVSVYKEQEAFIIDIGKNIFVLKPQDDFQAVDEKIIELIEMMLDNLLKEKRKGVKPTIGFIREIKK